MPTGPFESMAKSGGGFGSVAGGLMRGFAEGMAEQSASEIQKEIEARKQLAEQFKRIADDNAYDPQSRQEADRHYVTLMMLEPGKKRPREYQPDKAYNGLPKAYFDVTYRQLMRKGPGEPKEPKPPADPTISVDQQSGRINAMPPMPQMPPGLDQLGAAGPTAAAVPPAAAPALGEMPQIDFSQYEPTRRTPMQLAEEQAGIKAAERRIQVTPEIAEQLGLPAGTSEIDSELLKNLRFSEDREARMALQGFDREGNRLPWREALDAAKVGLQSAQAEAQKAMAAGQHERASAILLQANAAMLAAQASMERASNPSVSVLPIYSNGTFAGTYGAEKTPGFTPAGDVPTGASTKPPAAANTKTAAATQRGAEYRAERAKRIIASIDDLIPRISALTVGPMANVQIPGTPAANFAADLETLRSNIAFQELQEMRDASKTGGALGQVAVRELELLESTLGALDQKKQSPANFKKNMDRIRQSFERWGAAKDDAESASSGANLTPPPTAERIVGQTTAIIGGREMVWTESNGRLGWAPRQ